jgi:hypothetical protein
LLIKLNIPTKLHNHENADLCFQGFTYSFIKQSFISSSYIAALSV